MQNLSNTLFEQDVFRTSDDLMPLANEIYRDLGTGQVTPQIVRFYKSFDDLYERSKTPISCKSGCTYCCHYHVLVTAPEVFGISEVIAKLPSNQREKIQSRIRSNAKIASTLSADEYIHTNIECAMLDAGKCTIYSVRPIACRGHHSADVTVCKEAFDDVNSTTQAPKDYAREVIFQAFNNVQIVANHVAKLDTNRYELHAALSEAIDNPASFKRWKLGKSAFPSVKDKSTLK